MMVLPSFLQPTGTETMIHTSVGKKLALSSGSLIKTLSLSVIVNFFCVISPNLRHLVQTPHIYVLLNSVDGGNFDLGYAQISRLGMKENCAFELL